jgi:hypothetical protein
MSMRIGSEVCTSHCQSASNFDPRSAALDTVSLAAYKAVIVVTEHGGVDCSLVVKSMSLATDTRSVIVRGNLDGDIVGKVYGKAAWLMGNKRNEEHG